jgi:hypothetical protein
MPVSVAVGHAAFDAAIANYAGQQLTLRNSILVIRQHKCAATKHAISIFCRVAAYEPTDPDLLAKYRRIITGLKPHQAYLCQQLGIGSYANQLVALLFLCFDCTEGKQNLIP